MRYSFMSFSCPDQTLPELLATAKRYGYDGIEIRTAANHRHGIELGLDTANLKDIRNAVARSGVPIACLATSCSFADPRSVAQEVDTTRRYINLAADIGTRCIRVFGGAIPDDISRNQAIETVAGALLALAPLAAERNVIVCMETHDDWCDPRHVAKVMQTVNHPQIAVNWDIMHSPRMGYATVQATFDMLKPWIRHVHMHDGINDGGRLCFAPIGTGYVDHKLAIALLTASAYQGYMSGEWIAEMMAEPYAVYLPREIATLKRYENELTS